MPGKLVIHACAHVESDKYPTSKRTAVTQDVHCARETLPSGGLSAPPDVGDGGLVDATGCALPKKMGDGVTTSWGGCGDSDRPFLHVGACASDVDAR